MVFQFLYQRFEPFKNIFTFYEEAILEQTLNQFTPLASYKQMCIRYSVS